LTACFASVDADASVAHAEIDASAGLESRLEH